MLFANDIFTLDGLRYRLLSASPAINTAWCIHLDNALAWPVHMDYHLIRDLPRQADENPLRANVSPARLARCNQAYQRLKKLIDSAEDALFEPRSRNHAIETLAIAEHCSPRTLQKDLRRYWMRGQTNLALLPDFQKCGNPQSESAPLKGTTSTGHRGRHSKRYETFQIGLEDAAKLRAVIESDYLKDSRHTIADAYLTLIQKHYQFQDGNQQSFVNPPGERPSLRQFSYFLKNNYNIETRLRSRHGDSDYEREHRKKVGTILADCLGVGHFYEIDSTIGDIYLVSSHDPNKIIGKPTIYLIIDRKSRLIVGFYFGLENASWVGAMQAISSISEDKRGLCERYGVVYNEADWPAHQVFPSSFLADRGDMIAFDSSNIVSGIHSTVINLPARRPDYKPVVECSFRQTHHTLHATAPAYDPPANATRRQGKRYDKDACLTTTDFGNLMLNAIIRHNRRSIKGYDLSPNELMDDVTPNPIELWNHGVLTRSGLLRTYGADFVQRALLPRAKGVVTEHGLEFKGCFYSCAEAINQKWFEHARRKRSNVEVSFDPRLVDSILVCLAGSTQEPFVATLTTRSQAYTGMSFGEVAFYAELKKAVECKTAESRLQNSIDYRTATDPVIAAAKKKLKAAGGGGSRRHRRADTKAERELERTIERQELARIQDASPMMQSPPAQATDSKLVVLTEAKPTQTTADRIAEVRRQMLATG